MFISFTCVFHVFLSSPWYLCLMCLVFCVFHVFVEFSVFGVSMVFLDPGRELNIVIICCCIAQNFWPRLLDQANLISSAPPLLQIPCFSFNIWGTPTRNSINWDTPLSSFINCYMVQGLQARLACARVRQEMSIFFSSLLNNDHTPAHKSRKRLMRNSLPGLIDASAWQTTWSAIVGQDNVRFRWLLRWVCYCRS